MTTTDTISVQEYFCVKEAAPKLGMSPDALRRLIERIAEEKPNGDLVANLGNGIVAFKFGRRKWMVKFPR